MSTTTPQSTFACLLQDYFGQRLISQRDASPRTVASYRDTFCLLLRFSEQRLGKSPVALTLGDLDATLILAFLDHLEQNRKNAVRSRNLRLAAIRSFFHYAALREPTALPTVQQVLAIPFKRFDRRVVDYLSLEEVEALLAAPDAATWSGHRDRTMFATLYNTGARVSEIAGLNIGDVEVATTATVRLRGKGRKERTVPLWRTTRDQIREWLRHTGDKPASPLFANRRGERLTRSGIQVRLRAAVEKASVNCPTLRGRRISPHTFRHTTAMHLLQSGVDITVIALWLGHASPATTHIYVEADLAMKQRALSKLERPAGSPFRFRPTDRLLAFLEAL